MVTEQVPMRSSLPTCRLFSQTEQIRRKQQTNLVIVPNGDFKRLGVRVHDQKLERFQPHRVEIAVNSLGFLDVISNLARLSRCSSLKLLAHLQSHVGVALPKCREVFQRLRAADLHRMSDPKLTCEVKP